MGNIFPFFDQQILNSAKPRNQNVINSKRNLINRNDAKIWFGLVWFGFYKMTLDDLHIEISKSNSCCIKPYLDHCNIIFTLLENAFKEFLRKMKNFELG